MPPDILLFVLLTLESLWKHCKLCCSYVNKHVLIDHMNENSVSRTHSSGLKRDLSILEVLSTADSWAGGGMGVNRISQLTGRDKAQVSRSLATLAESGLVDRDPSTLAYRLGHHLYMLATRTQEAHLSMISERFMRDVVALTGETSHISVRRGGQVLMLSSEMATATEYDRGLESGYLGGRAFPISASAAGRTMLAYLGDEILQSWMSEFAVATSELLNFAAEATKIREYGYGSYLGGFSENSVEIAAPVRDASNLVVAAISVAGNEDRIGPQIDQIGQLLSASCIELSIELGAPIFGPG